MRNKSKYSKKSVINTNDDQSLGRLFNAFYTEVSVINIISKLSETDDNKLRKMDNIISSTKLLVDIILSYKAIDHESILGYAPREKIALMDAMIKDFNILYDDKCKLSKQIVVYRISELSALFVDLVDLVYCDNQRTAFNDVSHISNIIDCIRLLYKNHNKINEIKEDTKYLNIIFNFIQKSIPHETEELITNFIKSAF